MWAEIRHGGHVGRGEGAPDDRYGESVDCCPRVRRRRGRRARRRSVRARGDRGAPARAGRLGRRAAAQSSVRCTTSSASSSGSRPGACSGSPDRTPETSYTIGIDSVDGTADRARRAAEAGYRRLKIKLGGEGDLERLHAIRAVCDLPLRVDANEGWGLDEARRLLPTLVELGVELIEQPFPAGERDTFRELRALGGGIPLVVDEGCHTLRDVADVATYADGVNLKLAKTGGIREAVRMIHAARALGLVVMLGCMIESSVGISAAAQFASLCDFVDLDGHLLDLGRPGRGPRARGRAHRALAAARPRRGAAARERARRGLRRGLPAHLERQGRPRADPLRRARGRGRGRLAARGAAVERGRAVREQARADRRDGRPRRRRSARSASPSASRRRAASCRRRGRTRCSRRSRSGLHVEAGLHDELGARPRPGRRGRCGAGSSCATSAASPPGSRRRAAPGSACRRAIVHTVGTDCAIGKMTVTLELAAAAQAPPGERAVFVPTGPDRASRSRAGASPSTTSSPTTSPGPRSGSCSRVPSAATCSSSRARARSCIRSTRASRSGCSTARRRTRSCSCTRRAPSASTSRIAAARRAR